MEFPMGAQNLQPHTISRLCSQMKVKKRSFRYAQMHLKLHNGSVKYIETFFLRDLLQNIFSDKLEHGNILVSDFRPIWQLLTATRAEIYFHCKFTTVAYYINFKSSWAEEKTIFFKSI